MAANLLRDFQTTVSFYFFFLSFDVHGACTEPGRGEEDGFWESALTFNLGEAGFLLLLLLYITLWPAGQ